MPESTTELVSRFRAGDRRACGRVISLVECDEGGSTAFLNELYPLAGRAYRVGVTGPPGAGKSTLVEKLALTCRGQGRTVGVVAVDPTSPFSGGAVLGDRVRMGALFTDPGVYIRSMATRGGLGGLAVRTKEVCDVLDAFGCEVIIVETVGVGQMELDVAEAVHTTVVVLVPESGDSIQALKAGLMEIADVYCVNKSDRDGADRLVLEIEGMLELRPRSAEWLPPVVKTVATVGSGVDELWRMVEQHRTAMDKTGATAARRERRLRRDIVALVDERLLRQRWQRPGAAERLGELAREAAGGLTTPYAAADELARWFGQ